MTEPHNPAPVHPAIAPLAGLLGTWRGAGHGNYPTIEPFGYLEEIFFGHIGRPFLTYRQRTRHADDNRPLHVETGYLRCPDPDRVELILSHATGITEICEGKLTLGDEEIRLDLESTTIGLSTTAKEVTALSRSVHMHGTVIDYTLQMGAVGLPLQNHLAASLHKI